MERWIKIKTKPKVSPPIFYLNWENPKSYPNKHAEWLNEMPKNTKINFKKTINWKEFKSSVLVCGTFPEDKSEFIFYENDLPPCSDIPLLKSHLQKSIRRNKPDQAVKTAFNLMDLDFTHFIRRIIIIMIEDVYIHQSINTLTWIMLAIEDWKPSKNHIEWLLGVVAFLADTKYRIIHGRIDKLHTQTYFQEISKINNSKYRSSLWSLLIRKSYGGMKGDMEMINHTIFKYLNEFQVNKDKKSLEYFHQKFKAVDTNLDKLMNNEWIPNAVDFHCCPNIIFMIQNNFWEEGFEDNDIKKAIWEFSSKITYKKELIEEEKQEEKESEPQQEDEEIKNLENTWNIIKKEYIKIAFSILRKKIS